MNLTFSKFVLHIKSHALWWLQMITQGKSLAKISLPETSQCIPTIFEICFTMGMPILQILKKFIYLYAIFS